MDFHYRFFSNFDCEYFPCHKIKEGDSFNCLFCYCPLYLKENCPGTPAYVVRADGSRIKDCSNCLFPHKPENYDRIIACLKQQEEICRVSCEDLYETAYQQMEKMCGFMQMPKDANEMQQKEAGKIYQKCFQEKSISVMLKPFDKSCIKEDYFLFGKEKILCQVLKRISADKIKKGYVYTCHAPQVSNQEGLLQEFYVESWQIAFLDSIRYWLREYLMRKEGVFKEAAVTDSFGPGFYGMPVTAAGSLLKLLNSKRVGVTIQENGTMMPLKSLVGIYLVLEEAVSWPITDCSHCIGGKDGCEFCGKRSEKIC